MRIATASLRTGLAMTGFLQGVWCKSGRRGVVTPPYILLFISFSVFIFWRKGGTIGVYFYWEMNV